MSTPTKLLPPLRRIAGLVARSLARYAFGPARSATRQYANARPSRTSPGFGSYGNSSEDAELSSSLTSLRSRSRQMVRDNPYAKRAQTLIVNNVVGSGVGLQAQVVTPRGDLAARINAEIEEQWAAWCCADACHTGGALHFSDMERMLLGEVFEAGEVLVRLHMQAFGASHVPLALEIIEPERLANELIDPGTFAGGGVAEGNELRMSVEVDRFGRAVAYWIRQRHPGDVRGRISAQGDRFERVPAAEILHLRLIHRWPQTRGTPWMHTVLRKLDDLGEYSGSEVQAARAASYYFGTVTSAGLESPLKTGEDADGAGFMAIEPLTIQELKPGEEFEFHTPNRPNTQLDPFMRYMLREIATGVGTSYESLSRDYSQSNYSSSRLAMLDDRDVWRVLQQWWVRSFRVPLHRLWVQQAVLTRAVQSVALEQYMVAPEKFCAAMYKVRGWSWVDPTKEVTAYKEAVMAGFITISDVIAATAGGMDIEDVIATRRRELDMLTAAGIQVDTTVTAATEKAASPADPNDAEDPPDKTGKSATTQAAPGRLVSFPR